MRLDIVGMTGTVSRQKLMGWADGSPMAMHYSSRHENKRAFDVGLKLQEDRSSSKGKDKGQSL
jgi:hypothetical protein